MSAPTALVTGAGPGSLGEATASLLRAQGFRVVATTRSCPPSADEHPLDLASAASVSAFASWLGGATDRLDVLVNNAGIHLNLRSTWTAPQLLDGHETHWRTNYLGTAHLTRLLLPLLSQTARSQGEARVVNVVSKLHDRGRNEALFGPLTPYDSWAAYGTSKLGLVHEAAEIERRYRASGVHGYSLHPGSVYTRIADRGLETAPLLARLRKVLAPLERRALKTPEQGARTTVWCATSPDAEPGGYHRDCRPADPSPDAQDGEVARRLWDETSSWAAEWLGTTAGSYGGSTTTVGRDLVVGGADDRVGSSRSGRENHRRDVERVSPEEPPPVLARAKRARSSTTKSAHVAQTSMLHGADQPFVTGFVHAGIVARPVAGH